jgi:dTDP-4-dehydrorhamnose reductase
MRVLVTGATGLLGAAIVREFRGGWEVHAFDRASLDIADDASVARAVRDARPDVIVNCAAYTDVDRAEDQPVAALDVNAFGVLSLARAARAHGAVLVHYSTDFVFDGHGDRPYTEADRPNPRGVYAASKMIGEWFALESPGGYVLRVESLFGEPGERASRHGSLAMLIDRIRQGEEAPVFIDRVVSPSYTTDIAWATRSLIERRAPAGLYHCVNAGARTWAEIAQSLAHRLGRPLNMKPLTLETAALRAPRPRYSALNPAKLASIGIVMPDIDDAVGRYLRA